MIEVNSEIERWRMAAEMTANDVAFFSPNEERPRIEDRFCLFCNDTFWWATADAEHVLWEQIPEVYAIYKAQGEAGLIDWISEKRGIRPMTEAEASLDKLKRARREIRNSALEEAAQLAEKFTGVSWGCAAHIRALAEKK